MPEKKPLRSILAARAALARPPVTRAPGGQQLVESVKARGLRQTAIPPPKNREPEGPFPMPGTDPMRPPEPWTPGKVEIPDPLVHNGIKLGLPISLTSRILLSSGNSGSPPLLPLKADVSMEISAITFALAVVDVRNLLQSLGNLVGVSLDLDGVQLTAGSTPLAVLCLRDIPEMLNFNTPGGVSGAQYVWNLPEPLYVPKGSILRPVFQHGGFLDQDIGVVVSYIGNVATGVPPRTMRVPWVASWGSKSFGPVDADTDISDPSALINPFDVPLCVCSINGRVLGLASALYGALSLKYALESTLGAHQAGAFLVSLTTSAGDQIADQVPFWQLFESWHCGLRVPFLLPARGYLVAEVESTPEAAVNIPGELLTAQIAISGWREVKRS